MVSAQTPEEHKGSGKGSHEYSRQNDKKRDQDHADREEKCDYYANQESGNKREYENGDGEGYEECNWNATEGYLREKKCLNTSDLSYINRQRGDLYREFRVTQSKVLQFGKYLSPLLGWKDAIQNTLKTACQVSKNALKTIKKAGHGELRSINNSRTRKNRNSEETLRKI